MQWIELAQAGDQEAFGHLFEEYKNLVYKTAYLMLGTPEEAEDALQEIFLRVYAGLSSYDAHKGAFSTWLHRVTFNYCLNQQRGRREMLSTADDELIAGISDFPGEYLAEREALERAIRQLSERQRAVIILRYYWELSLAEVAAILELPLGTVKSRLDLALKTLRKALAERSECRSVSPIEVYP